MMRLRLLMLVLAAAIAEGVAAAAAHAAIVIGFDVTPQSGPGGTLEVAVRIDGLGGGAAPSVGAFDLDIQFDSSILHTPTVTFGDPVLGDQLDLSGFGALNLALPLPAGINLIGVSLDPADILDASQAPAFVLATLTFLPRTTGSSALDIVVREVVDANAGQLSVSTLSASADVVAAQVPEPAAVGLLLAGFWTLEHHRRRGRRTAQR